MKIKLTPIIDVGHGGMIGGVYQTPGKRSPKWEKGILYEGMANRWYGSRIIEKLDRRNVPYYPIFYYQDISLGKRAQIANNYYKQNNNTYLFSIHANAGGGTGMEGYTTKGYTISDPLGEFFLSIYKKELPIFLRTDLTDGDLDKEANFQILRDFIGRAFLIETSFMDNKKDYDLLWSEKFADQFATVTADAMEFLYKEGLYHD